VPVTVIALLMSIEALWDNQMKMVFCPGHCDRPNAYRRGHASVSMTFDRYGHLFESIKADACLGGDRRRAVDGHSARSPSLALRRVSLCHFHLHALLQNRASPRLARKRMPPLTLRLRASRATATAPAASQYSPRSRPGSPRRRHFNPS
jgi:hypothetical protein